MNEKAPAGDVIEVSIFSRGYGEAIAVHVGGGRWLLIDSLKSLAGRPCSIEYLESIGADCKTAVQAVLLTHWHDGHVDGASAIVEACLDAAVVLSGALRRDEFVAFLRRTNVETAGTFGTGVQELVSVLKILKAANRQPKWAWADKILAASRDEAPYRFEALSPSERDFEHLLQSIPGWVQTGGRMPAPARNDASVAAVIEAAGEQILLGADLEVRNRHSGWQAVHENVWKDRGLATLFKIAHHGSINGDYEPVWADMLVRDVIAVLTPWSRGKKLPREEDVARILSHTCNAHAAAQVRSSKATRRSNTVEKSLREANIKIRKEQSEVGHVRFRKQADEPWQTDYISGGSCHLSKVIAA
jgi:hypothetical protein